jgi:hypothetical protein
MIGARRSAGSRFRKEPILPAKQKKNSRFEQGSTWGLDYLRGVMITATWTWTDIRNFEEDAQAYQRAQLAWTLILIAALSLVIALLG